MEQNVDMKKCKGLPYHVLQEDIVFLNYLQKLLAESPLLCEKVGQSMSSTARAYMFPRFRSYQMRLQLVRARHVGLSSYDNKRLLCPFSLCSRSYGCEDLPHHCAEHQHARDIQEITSLLQKLHEEQQSCGKNSIPP